MLENINWDQFLPSNAPIEAYNTYLKIFSDLYDIAFPKKEIKIKSKYLNTPWFTKGLRKSSKRKQRLNEKFLKNQTLDNEKIYKDYKTYLRKLKIKQRKIITELKLNLLKMIYEVHGK